jgi:hypothetical protein
VHNHGTWVDLLLKEDKVLTIRTVVSHSGFLRVGVSHRHYENADFRIFDFAEGHEDVGGKLIEREMTEQNGGGLGKSSKGIFLMSVGDYPAEAEEAHIDVGAVINENPT